VRSKRIFLEHECVRGLGKGKKVEFVLAKLVVGFVVEDIMQYHFSSPEERRSKGTDDWFCASYT
jgi:hypothetical protein